MADKKLSPMGETIKSYRTLKALSQKGLASVAAPYYEFEPGEEEVPFENLVNNIAQAIAQYENGSYKKCKYDDCLSTIINREISQGVAISPTQYLNPLIAGNHIDTSTSGRPHIGYKFVFRTLDEPGGMLRMGKKAELPAIGPPEAVLHLEHFGIEMSGSTMEPVYMGGNILWVFPRYPIQIGDDVLVCPADADDMRRYVGRFVRDTGTHWLIHQFTPEVDQLVSKVEWPVLMAIPFVYRRNVVLAMAGLLTPA